MTLRRSERRARPSLLTWGGIALLAIVASIGLAACGGDDDDDGGDTGAAATTGETGTADATGGGGGETVDITATDFKFDPADPSVKPGEVTFDVTNDGQTLHNLEVEGPSGEAELAEDLQPGDSGDFSVDLSEAGTYEFYCPVGNHRDLGMVGEVTVQG